VKRIYAEESLRGFYKGISAALVGMPIGWAIFFSVYNTSKSTLEDRLVNPTAASMIASVSAAATNNIVLHPVWLARTRI
jgi:solute carrier family 25 folate transporter 32